MTPHDRMMDVLADAMDLPAGPARDAFLDAACGSDADLRRDLARMLARHDGAAAVFGDDRLAVDWVPESAFDSDSSIEATQEMTRAVGKRVGPYELLNVLGRGGMGVVYRGRDTRLNRDVAIKSLPAAAAHAAGVARFAREARLLASLSHPNLAAVYGLEETPAGRFLVMELVEGRTLARRLAEGPMPVDEAVAACAQVAAGLAAAHDAGVVHRDVKPGNVMLTPTGQVKVLDFGLARTMAAASDDGDVGDSSQAYASINVTAAHEVLGTPRYMSPEQLRGEPADRRSDVFAFGALLYECLTGSPAFGGDSVPAVVSAVTSADPDLASLPPATPSLVVALLRRCLAKDRDRRPRDLADVRLELEEVLAGPRSTGLRSTGFQPVSRGTGFQPVAEDQGHRLEACATNDDAGRGSPPLPPGEVAGRSPAGEGERRLTSGSRGSAKTKTAALQAAVLLAAVAATAVITRQLSRPSPAPQPPPTKSAATSQGAPAVERFTVPLPGGLPELNLARLSVAVDRDGKRVVVTSVDNLGGRRTFTRSRGDLALRPADSTPDPLHPSARAGPPCRLADGTVLFVPTWDGGIFAQDPGITRPRRLTAENWAEVAQLLPTAAPDGRSVVFTARGSDGSTWAERCRIDGTGRRVLQGDAAGARVVATPAGPRLLYERGGAIYAAPLDPATMELVRGGERKVADGVAVDVDAARPLFDAADDGTLVYVPGPRFVERSRLTQVQPGGGATPTDAPPGAFAEPRIGGRRVSVLVKGQTRSVWVYDAETWLGDRVPTAGEVTTAAVSPDGGRLAYGALTDRGWAVVVRALADGKEVRTTDGVTEPGQIAWTPDGRRVLFTSGRTGGDIWMIDVARGGGAKLWVEGPAVERCPGLSPDGRWLAYASDATGRREVYVREVEVQGGRPPVQVTQGGGDWPLWSSTESRLYFRAAGRVHHVPIDPGTGRPTAAAEAIPHRPFGQSDGEVSDYAVTPDGGLLVVEPSDDSPAATGVTVVLNWWVE